MYYSLKAPATITDRDFYLNEHSFIDYPEPGMVTIYLHSYHDEEEMPEKKDRVRVNLLKFGVVLKPYFD